MNSYLINSIKLCRKKAKFVPGSQGQKYKSKYGEKRKHLDKYISVLSVPIKVCKTTFTSYLESNSGWNFNLVGEKREIEKTSKHWIFDWIQIFCIYEPPLPSLTTSSLWKIQFQLLLFLSNQEFLYYTYM